MLSFTVACRAGSEEVLNITSFLTLHLRVWQPISKHRADHDSSELAHFSEVVQTPQTTVVQVAETVPFGGVDFD
jgi:hypothetical protein